MLGVGVGAGDVEVNISYITFMMKAQYTGLLGSVQDSHYTRTKLTCTVRNKPRQGSIKIIPL